MFFEFHKNLPGWDYDAFPEKDTYSMFPYLPNITKDFTTVRAKNAPAPKAKMTGVEESAGGSPMDTETVPESTMAEDGFGPNNY